MAFEVFTKQAIATSGQTYISIQKKGILSLNDAAYTALGEPAAVELLYDRDRQLVGLRPVDPGVEHAHAVRHPRNKSGVVVTAMRFAKHYGLPIDGGHRWPATLDGEVLCIDISKPPEA